MAVCTQANGEQDDAILPTKCKAVFAFRFLAPKSGVIIDKATHHVLTHVEATLGTYTRANEAAIWLMVSEASVALPPGGRDVATIGA